MADPVAPTITATDISVKVGESYVTAAAGSETGQIVAHVDFGTAVNNMVVKGKASAASYVYLSAEVGSLPVCEIPATTAADLTKTFNFSNTVSIYIADKTDATLDSTTHAIGEETTLISEYFISVIPDLNKIVRMDSFTVGMSNVKAYDISKYKYVTGGIPLVNDVALANMGGVLGVVSASIVKSDLAGGPYYWFYDKANDKLVLYSAVGTQLSANTEVSGTVILMKQ
jgi:hypothetical protein